MGNILNDRDALLSLSTSRIYKTNDDYISVRSSAPYFVRNGSTVTPSSITLTFELHGRLYGRPTITKNNIFFVSISTPTPTVTEVVINSNQIGTSSNICSVTASLQLWGNTYSVTAILSDSKEAPSPVTNVYIQPQGSLLLMTWNKSPDLDIEGYEVREVDGDWGLNNNYLYNGNVTRCTFLPSALNVEKSYYIRAYDSTKLYSPVSTVGTYTVQAPAAPVGLSASWSTSSATTSTATLTWTAATPQFGLYEYTVTITPINLASIVRKTSNNVLIVEATWAGSANVTVSVTDLLGNTSANSNVYVLTKEAPENIEIPISISPVGTKLLLNWEQPSRTTLPIIGYEVRKTNSGWGNSSYLWKGLVSECQVNPESVNTTTSYYVKAIDSSNQYSNNALATNYTVNPPPNVTSVSQTFIVTETGTSEVSYKWNIPENQGFGIEKYRVEITKPDNTVITLDAFVDYVTVTCDWQGNATVLVKTIDILGNISSGFTYTSRKVPLNVSNTSFSTEIIDDTVQITWTKPLTSRSNLAWTRVNTTATITDTLHGYTNGLSINITQSSDVATIPTGSYVINNVTTNTYTITCVNTGATSGTLTNSTESSLPIQLYEIRASDNTTVLYRGPELKATISKSLVARDFAKSFLPVRTVSWHLHAIDSAGKYSSNFKNGTFTVSLPSSAIDLTSTAVSTTVSRLTFTWSAPSVSNTQFSVSKYKVVLSRNLRSDVIEYVTAGSWSYKPDWVGSAGSLKVYTVDSIGLESSNFANIDITIDKPDKPGTMVFATSAKSVTLSWPLNSGSDTKLPLAGYEIRGSDDDLAIWGTDSGSLISKTTGTKLTLDADIYKTPETYDFYIKAYDILGNFSDVRKSDFVVTRPGSILAGNISHSFNNSSVGGTSVDVSWTTPTSTYSIDYYTLTLTRDNKTTNIEVKTYSNNYKFDVDWSTEATLRISATDIFGNTSTGNTAKTITKVAPSAPASATVTPVNNLLRLEWVDSVAGSLGIAGYEVRVENSGWGDKNFIYKGNSLFCDVLETSIGEKTWYIRAFDLWGQYSTTSLTRSYTISRPSTVTFPTPAYEWSTSLTNASVKLKWNASTSIFGIQYYQVSFSTVAPATPINTLTSTRLTNDWDIPAYWLGTGTLTVIAVDNNNIASNAATVDISKLRPNTPQTIILSSETGTTIELDWPDASSSTVPVAGYILRTDEQNNNPSLSTGLLFKGNTSAAIVDLSSFNLNVGNTKTFYLYSFDTSGYFSSSAKSYTYTAEAPVNTETLTARFEDTNLTSATVVLTWSDTFPTFGLKHYEISGELSVRTTTVNNSATLTVTSTKGINVGDFVSGANIPTAKKVTSINSLTELTVENGVGIIAGTAAALYIRKVESNSTSITLAADWLGSKTFVVRTVNTLGWKSSGTSRSITKALPSAPVNFSSQVVDNTVLLYWTLPPVTSLPINIARIKKGTTWETAEVIGDKSGSFTTITEFQGGTYTYWIALVDTDDNESTPISLTTTVNSPPDYIFNAQYSSIFDGSLINAKIDDTTGKIILPVNLTETFEQHFTTNVSPGDWQGPSAQVSAGFPVYIQPGLFSGFYEEFFDYGTTLGASQITLSLNGNVVVGTPKLTTTISTGTESNNFISLSQISSVTVTDNILYIVSNNISGVLPLVGSTILLSGIATTVPANYTSFVNAAGEVLASSVGQITVRLYKRLDTAITSVTFITTNTLKYKTINWSDLVDTSSMFSTNFRYIKVKISITQTTPGAIYTINNLEIKLDAKQKTDSESVVLDIGGAHAQYNIAPDYYTLWIPGSLPASGFNTGGVGGENEIVIGNGPAKQISASANQETLWKSTSTESSNFENIGFTTSVFPVDFTKKYLFSVFVNSTSNSQIFGFNTESLNGAQTLTNTLDLDPLFVPGNLPSLNSWYLLIGLVHESSYAGSSINISGIYDINTGTRLTAGTEFKFLADTTNIFTKVLHYDNPGDTFIARPVVMECTAADVNNKIAYLLQCATKHGKAVTPKQSYVDIASITTSPQGLVASIPIVDFYDIPNPKRFNIFNYTSAGVLTGGIISWTTRGY